MRYIEVTFSSNPFSEDIYDALASDLALIGFESFVQSDDKLLAYIDCTSFSELITDKIVENFLLDVDIEYTFKAIEDKNWNEEWEKNFFKPIVFNDKCIIHSSFHQPEEKYDYTILIDPKMSFGTGHHQTTGLMIKEIMDTNLEGKTVLDMGCGTAILAILASMRGAQNITAIDIDEWAYENAIENVELNKINNITVKHGAVELIENESYDIILANINRNILLEDIPAYTKALKNGGKLIMSGFYQKDIPMISEKCLSSGLVFNHFIDKDHWVAVVCDK